MSKQGWVYKVQDNGKLPDIARMDVAAFINQFPGKMLRIEISLYRKRRSDAQNAYYWAVVVPAVTRMLRDFGNEVNEFETHEYLKVHVMKLGRMVNGPDATVQFLPGSSSDIPLDEWSEKMEMIRAWASQQGTQIPLPGENHEPM